MPFRFKVDFYTSLNITDEKLTYCVTNITLPKIEGQASEGSLYLGNTIFTVPVWNVSSRKIDITFEETDTMLVSQFIDNLLHYYGRSPWYITIVVNEYEEHIRDEQTPNYVPGDKYATGYICHLASYDEPAFKRDGAAQQITITASFIVDSVIENWVEGMKPFTGNKFEQSNSELNAELTTLNVDEQTQKFTFGDVRFGSNPMSNSNERYGGFNKDKQAEKFTNGGTVRATRGGDAGYTDMTVNSAYTVKYDTASGKMYLMDNTGKVIKEAKAFTSNKGKETQKGGSIPKGKYILNNDKNSHNSGEHTKERNGVKVNENAMTLYGIEGSAGETLKKNKRSGINLHYGENSNWSEGCAVTPDTEFLKEVSSVVGNSNIIFEVS